MIPESLTRRDFARRAARGGVAAGLGLVVWGARRGDDVRPAAGDCLTHPTCPTCLFSRDCDRPAAGLWRNAGATNGSRPS
jgi:hypothetical protein